MVGLCLFGGCTFGPGGDVLDAWVVNEMVALTDKMSRVDDPLIFESQYGTVGLFGAGNETVCFQLVVDAGEVPIKQVRLTWTDLADDRGGRIPAANIRAFRMLPVKVDRYPPWYLRLVDKVPAPASFYDALVPVDAAGAGQPFDLKPGQRLALWIDVAIPRDARAGKYFGRVALESDGSGRWAAAIELKVYDFVLPDAQAVAAVGGFDHRKLFAELVRDGDKPFVPLRLDPLQPLVRRGLVVLRQLMRLAHEHRLDLFDKTIHPPLKRDAAGKVDLDWSNYDAIVRPYLDGTAFEDRIAVAAWPSPVSDAWPDPSNYGGAESKSYVKTFQSVAAAADKHLRSIKADKRIFYWPYRGPIGQGATKSMSASPA